MVKYVTGIQRLCVPEDIFWYAFWNTDVDGDRLLIKGCAGSTCVVGWHEVSVAFGARHSEAEEFRAIKINNKNMAPYRPGDFLPETVETNAQRKLVNGKPYEEISYYKDAAPYGHTYFLMTVIAELFWCNGRSVRFTTPMLYAYMRSLHGHPTNWAKVILHNLKTEIGILQKRAQSADNNKPCPVVWAPVFTRILYAFRESIFAGTQLANAEAWVSWIHTSKDGEIDQTGLHSKFVEPIVDLRVIRERCKLTDQIPLAEPINGDPANSLCHTPTGVVARKRPRGTQDVSPGLQTPADAHANPTNLRTVRTRVTSKKQKIVEVETDSGTSGRSSSPTGGVAPAELVLSTRPPAARSDDSLVTDFSQKLGVTLASVVSREGRSLLAEQLLAEAKLGASVRRQVDELTQKLRESERARSGLNVQVAELNAQVAKSTDKSALEAARKSELDLSKELEQVKKEAQSRIDKIQTDLRIAVEDVKCRTKDQQALKANVTVLTGQVQALKDASATTEAKLRGDNSALQEELQNGRSTIERYKVLLQTEMTKAARLDDQLMSLRNEVENHKFIAERADKAHAALRVEFNQVKTELRMLKLTEE
ncbi:hypothetical protein R1sor_021218 [Riccia sorocarpa]|uniref:Aminotransferase-like plant mobile domain-containing protein n=1 Tax=Riccia sorocarpa TaxID=122646 RepID=A0ABD3GJB9_9MARC